MKFFPSKPFKIDTTLALGTLTFLANQATALELTDEIVNNAVAGIGKDLLVGITVGGALLTCACCYGAYRLAKHCFGGEREQGYQAVL